MYLPITEEDSPPPKYDTEFDEAGLTEPETIPHSKLPFSWPSPRELETTWALILFILTAALRSNALKTKVCQNEDFTTLAFTLFPVFLLRCASVTWDWVVSHHRQQNFIERLRALRHGPQPAQQEPELPVRSDSFKACFKTIILDIAAICITTWYADRDPVAHCKGF